MKRPKTLWDLLAVGVAVIAIGVVVTLIIIVMRVWPSNEKQLVTRAGVLEFRIAPTLPRGEQGTELTEAECETYLSRLAEQDPLTTRSTDDKYLWFPIRNTCRMLASNLVIGERGDKKYILLYNQPDYMMLSGPGNPPWSISSAYPTRDVIGKPSVGFSLDKRGAKLMASLTGTHQDHFLAILVSDEVYSAPVIKSTIYDSGVITGNFTVQEVDKLIRTLEGRSLP